MQKNRTKLWISIAVVCCVISLFSVATHFLFKVKTIDVEIQTDLKTNTNLEPGTKDKIKTYFSYGENIVLMEYADSISKAEKENPYVKINQVIKVFPNIVRIYISERIPKFKVKNSENNGEWYIIDEDFKVLNIISEESSNFVEQTKNYIEISNINLEVSLQIGDFVTGNEECKSFINTISRGIYAVTEDYSFVRKISYESIYNDFDFKLVTRNDANENGEGCTIIIKGKENLFEKTRKGMSLYLKSEYKDGKFVNSSETIITITDDEKAVI